MENGRVLVIAGAAEVDDAVGGQDVLGTTGGVLGGTASNELGVKVVEQVLVQRLVLLLGEDGVVGLEAVLLEQSLVALGLDVCKPQGVGLAKTCIANWEARISVAYLEEGSPDTGDGIPCWQPFRVICSYVMSVWFEEAKLRSEIFIRYYNYLSTCRICYNGGATAINCHRRLSTVVGEGSMLHLLLPRLRYYPSCSFTHVF